MKRDFRLLFAGLTASIFGDSVLLLALGIWTKSLTGSTRLAGLAMLAVVAPAPLAPVLGFVVDRFRRRPFLIVANLAAGAALCPLFLVRRAGDVWLLLAVSVLYGMSFIVLDAGLAGLLKELLPDEALARANGSLATVRQALRLAGPLIGAGLFAAFGPVPIVALDAASFGLAAAAVAGLRHRGPRPAREHGWRAGIAAGARHVVNEPALRWAVLSVAVAALVFGAIETISFGYVDQGLHRSPAFLGVLVTAQSIGGVLGGVLAAPLQRRVGELAAIATGLLALAVGMALMTYPVLPLAFVAMPVEGLGLPPVIVGLATVVQRRTGAPMVGRVSALVGMLTDGPQALSIAASALLVSIVDYRWLLAGIATVLCATAGSAWRVRWMTPASSGRKTSDPAAMMLDRGGRQRGSARPAGPGRARRGAAGGGDGPGRPGLHPGRRGYGQDPGNHAPGGLPLPDG